MKSINIAKGIGVLGAVMFFYQIHQISELNQEAEVLVSRINANENPGAGAYVRAAFDGFTLGAFADEGIFTEANKNEREAKQIRSESVWLITRYNKAVSYRNWGLLLAVGGIIGICICKNENTA